MSIAICAQSKLLHLNRVCPLRKPTHIAAALTISNSPFTPNTKTTSSRVFKKQFASVSTRVRGFPFMGTDLAPSDPPAGMNLATFAGGCFWGLELAFQRVPGVIKTSVGYTQGRTKNPTYQQVCSGMTGHTEAVQVVYDPNEVQYEVLLETFFEKTDPTTLNRQGGDAGTQYRSGIYFHSPEQKSSAENVMTAVQKKIESGQFRRTEEQSVVVELLPAGDYYLAEDYHQQYLEKGGRFNQPQSSAKGCKDPIRCYG